MRKKSYENSKLKRQLLSKKRNGEAYTIWSLTKEQLDFVNQLGFSATPEIFRINTCSLKSTMRMNHTPALVKEVYRAKRDRKINLFKALTSREQKLLREHGISFVPYKYKILLQ